MLRPERRTRRGMREAGTARPWVDHLVLAAALGVLLTGYTLVVEGTDWWITTLLVSVLIGLVCAVLRAVGVRWVAPVALAVLALAITWIFVPETLLGVIPTPASVGALGAMLDRAQLIIMEEAPPAAAARPIVLVLAGAFGLVVVVADAMLRRRRGELLVGVLLLGVYAAPALVSGESPSLWQFLVPAALWLVLLRLRTSGASLGGASTLVPAVALGAAALGVGIVLPPALPDVTAVASRWGEPPPTVFGRGINPMLQLGQNLRRNSTVVSARYATSLDTPPYLKVSTLRDFSGRTWRPTPRGTGGIPEGLMGLRDDIAVTEETTDIRIADLRSSMLPVPYPAIDIDGLEGTWSWQRAGQTISSRSADTEDQEYSVDSLDIAPTANQMRSLPQGTPSSMRPYLELPDDVPRIVTDTAREVTADAGTDYDKAVALQTFLREDFRYSETAPVAGDYDGNGVQVLGEFLQERSGYCVHFSSAMAVMARDLGIASRVAVGYAPGRATAIIDGSTEFEVTSDDLHAWPELYFGGVGWVQFEPTPGIGRTTQFEEPDAGLPDAEGEEESESQGQRADAQDRVEADQAAAQDQPTAPRSVLVVGLGVVLLALGPGVLRAWLRRRRIGRGEDDPDPLWRELEATAVDLGVQVSATDTPRGLAGRLRATTAADPESLARLLHGVETARYAWPGAVLDDERETARRLIGSLDAAALRRTRWRARLLPRSLFR